MLCKISSRVLSTPQPLHDEISLHSKFGNLESTESNRRKESNRTYPSNHGSLVVSEPTTHRTTS